MLDLPDLVEAEFVGQTDLLKRLVVDAPFGGLGPGTLHRMFVEDAEFHVSLAAPPAYAGAEFGRFPHLS